MFAPPRFRSGTYRQECLSTRQSPIIRVHQHQPRHRSLLTESLLIGSFRHGIRAQSRWIAPRRSGVRVPLAPFPCGLAGILSIARDSGERLGRPEQQIRSCRFAGLLCLPRSAVPFPGGRLASRTGTSLQMATFYLASDHQGCSWAPADSPICRQGVRPLAPFLRSPHVGAYRRRPIGDDRRGPHPSEALVHEMVPIAVDSAGFAT